VRATINGGWSATIAQPFGHSFHSKQEVVSKGEKTMDKQGLLSEGITKFKEVLRLQQAIAARIPLLSLTDVIIKQTRYRRIFSLIIVTGTRHVR
jgi:hypothetical protein